MGRNKRKLATKSCSEMISINCVDNEPWRKVTLQIAMDLISRSLKR